MANVVPGYSWLGSTDPITASKLNLTAQPSISIGTNEVTLANLATLTSNNQLLGRSTTSSGNVQAIDLTTTGLGFYTGAGGTQTQLTSKATAFTLSKMCGTITTAADALNAGVIVSSTWTNTLIAATDVVVVSHKSGGTVGSYTINVAAGAGTATLTLRNNTAGNLSEALVISYVVIKGVSS